MDSLLPSEIARLVLGYLEDQKCDDAARSFLEMSPHLHECRAMSAAGRRFSTKVNGFTLTDILDKYCAANATIQERLSKVSDCEQLKHCGDLSEQLRFLVDGSRGQRFVVNINVPTASQTSAGSPIISSSVRKRHHSGSERDRPKRAPKPHSQSWGKTSEQASSRCKFESSPPPSTNNIYSRFCTPVGCDAIETTPLEHLPGHTCSNKSDNNLERNFEKSSKEIPTNCCSSTVTDAVGSKSLPENRQSTSLPEDEEPRNSGASDNKIGPKRKDVSHEKCSTATDTEELMRFTNTEVQTTPYDVAESETELTDEPVENLSLLTKELLNRTELQERIADNINKAILPADNSMRDASLTEALGGEINTSIMTELNNAIKSVVPAIESDPVFAKFLDEIIGPNAENDTSPDEDAADHQPLKAVFSDISPDSIVKPTAIESSTPQEKKTSPPPETPEVPLKNRLRSSAIQQTVRPEQDKVLSQKPIEKEDAALEDLNAAAILSIINANNKSEEERHDADPVDDSKKIVELAEAVEVENTPSVVPEIPEATNTAAQLNVPTATGATKPSRKANVRKPRAKSKPKVPEVISEKLITEEEIMAMPTLIVCSKEEMSCLISVPPAPPNPAGGYCASQFLPIAPKTSDVLPPPRVPPIPEAMYLRTVHVPMNVSKPTVSQVPAKTKEVQEVPRSKPKEPRGQSNEIQKSTENILTSVLDLPTKSANPKIAEKVTLYSNENSKITVLEDTVFPTINLVEPVSVSGTGLSPFLKFNNNKSAPDSGVERKSAQAMEATIAAMDSAPMEQEAAATASTSIPESLEILTKRTPRSLLKSRSKNHRLSLSTPRRRSSHIRALDFNTPTKGANCSRRMSITDKSMQFSPTSCKFVKNVCRTSLFKSPPFSGSPTASAKKIKSSPVKDCRIPIATRSPAPKLMGGWEKYTGVGIILGGASPSSTTSSPVKNTATTSNTVKKSWDADLRKSLQIAEDPPKVAKKAPPKKLQSCKRRNRKKKLGNPSVAPDEVSCEVESAAKESAAPAISTTPAECANEKPQPAKVTKETVNLTNKSDELPTKSTGNENLEQKTAEVMSTSSETVKIHTDDGAIVKSSKIVKKKYAQLKTLTSTVTRIERCESGLELPNNAMERSEKSTEFDRHCPESSQRSHLPNMLDLETPRKLENNFGIPPTPRFLSPGSNLTTPFAVGISEDSVKVMRSFIPTPEFPPTPSIAITPKQLSENTVESGKKDDFACSDYYQPSSELKDPRVPKLHNDQSRHDMSLPLPGMITTSKEIRVNNISAQVAQGFQASTTSGKLEITQFEVIKENLPREEAFKELKIESATVEIVKETVSAVIDPPTDVAEATKEADKSGSTIDDNSSDSDSSCSSDSSSSSSSSSSDSSSVTNTSANVTLTKQYTKRTPNKIYTDTSNDSIPKSAANALSGVIAKNVPAKSSLADHNNLKTMLVSSSSSCSRVENESSPKKVFPIVKTQEAIDEAPAETPVKDDTLLTEANISETPSSSKAGFDNVTNLTTKISAFITTEECKRGKTTEITEKKVAEPTRKSLPKIISVQRILPDVSIALKPSSGNDLCNAMQNRPNPSQQVNALSNAKLSRQLEEKRLRLMAKFKEKDTAPAYRPRIKRTVAIAKARKRPETNEIITENIANGRTEEEELPKTQSSRLPDAERSVENSRNNEKVDEQKKKQEAKNMKAERDKKAQMLKDLFDESCSTSTPIKIGKHDETAEDVDVVSQVNEAEKKSSTDTNIDKEQKDEGPKNDPKSKSRTRQSQESTKPKDKLTDRNLVEPKTSKQSAKLDENVSEELSEKFHPHSSVEAQCEEKAKSQTKEECTAKETATTISVEPKKTSKSKVDLVKRDLFSDEESSDQRTTRSRTRQTCDLSKNESIEGDILSDKIDENGPMTTQKEDLPGVLECLHLVPTIKNDTMEEDSNVLDTSQRHAEFHFIYDDSVPTKRRKRKFSNSELEFSVEVELSDDDYQICSKVMKATAYEEIFNLSPPRKKRGPTKETVKTIKYNKKETPTQISAKTFFSDIQDKPLATSSPVVKPSVSKIVASKVVKSPSKKIDAQPTDTKKKPTVAKIDKQPENEKTNPKSRKRKASTSKDSEQVGINIRSVRQTKWP